MKIGNKIIEWFAGKRLDFLSKECVEYKNDEYITYNEEGVKTNGRYEPMEVVRYALIHVYGYATYRTMFIQGIDIKEDTEKITVTISTHRPGVIISSGGEAISVLADVISRTFRKYTDINIDERKVLFGIGWTDEY